MTRKRIGRTHDIASRQVVYQTAEGLEVDDYDHLEIIRKRVFFDDVQLITKHKQFGSLYLFATGLPAVGAIALALTNFGTDSPDAILWLSIAGIFIIAFMGRIVLKQDVVTVFGRRSKAVLRSTFRKAYIEEKFQEFSALVQQAQERVAAEQRALEEKRSAEVPLPEGIELPPADVTTSDPPQEQ